MSPQDKLKADQPAAPTDFAGAVAGRGAGGKSGKEGKGGKSGKGGNSRRQPLQLVEAPDRSNQPPQRNAENQDKRVRPARVQQAQQREVCKKYFKGDCDMQHCKSFHLFPCKFFYDKSKKCVKPVNECGFSHEFDVAGLRNHVKLHRLDPAKFGLPSPSPSAGREIIQPILNFIDCRDCGQTHASGKCRKKRASFSGLVRTVERDPADLNRFGALINEHAGQDADASD